MGVSFEPFVDILNHPIRRKIILGLSEKGSISYVDLMNLVGTKNTGKFNYHLKILGDLVEKSENGKYGLSDKGKVAVQFLQKFAGKETESIPLPIAMKTFETRAFSLGHGFIWVLLVEPLVFVLFSWGLFFSDRANAFIGNPTIPLLIFTLIAALPFTLFGMATFPKITIDQDSIVVKYAFIRQLSSLEDARIDPKGHILKLGTWPSRGWYIPFKERECIALLDKEAGTYRSKPFFLLYLFPLLISGLYYELSKGALDPLFWAINWGATAAISFTIFVYATPGNTIIKNLSRGSSSIVLGLPVGILISFFMFLTTVLKTL